MTIERRTGPDRRSRRISLRYPERRSGFDRRRPQGPLARAHDGLLRAYRSRPGLLVLALALLVALNAGDLLLTQRALERGARELNPVLRWLLASDPALAWALKSALGAAVALVIWRLRGHRRMLEVSLLLVAGLASLLAYQAVGLLLVLPG